MSATHHPSARSRPAGRPFSLLLSLQSSEPSGIVPVSRTQIRRWILSALECDAELTLRFVGQAEAVALNRSFRGKAYAPDVLTFAYTNTTSGKNCVERRGRSAATPVGQSRLRADIVLCMSVVRAQARQARMTSAHRLAHLVIHGVLHAQGYDHETPDQAQTMQARESELLRRFRIADPWA